MERSLCRPTVVFDIGGVLTSSEGGVPELSARLGIDRARFEVPYWKHRPDYDRGGAADTYWHLVAADLGMEFDDDDVRRLDDLDAARWARLAPGRAELITALQADGVRTALLSNAPASMAAVVRAAGWSAGFEHRLFSSELTLLKPEESIYRATEETLGRSGPELVFFDDREPNVEAARRRGWRAYRWTDLRSCLETLTGLGLPTGPAQT